MHHYLISQRQEIQVANQTMMHASVRLLFKWYPKKKLVSSYAQCVARAYISVRAWSDLFAFAGIAIACGVWRTDTAVLLDGPDTKKNFKPVHRYAAYTLFPIPYTLHPTPYALHPNPIRGALAFRGQALVPRTPHRLQKKT
jgi:hypothetical protein